MNKEYIKFTGEYSKLKSMGYRFQRMFAANYMAWWFTGDDLVIYKKGSDLVLNAFVNDGSILRVLLESPMQVMSGEIFVFDKEGNALKPTLHKITVPFGEYVPEVPEKNTDYLPFYTNSKIGEVTQDPAEYHHQLDRFTAGDEDVSYDWESSILSGRVVMELQRLYKLGWIEPAEHPD